MPRKPRSSPETSSPETRAPEKKPSPPAPKAKAEELETDVEELDDDDASPTYPLFPHLPLGSIHTFRVYRKVPKDDGTKGTRWLPISVPFDPAETTWDLITQVLGGGMFSAVGKNRRGQTLGNVQRTFEGPPRQPTAHDIASMSPGLAAANPIAETANGWIGIPHVDPGTQAAFIAFQQAALYARQEAATANAAMAMLLEKLLARSLKPDPGLTVLENLVETMRGTQDRLQNELRAARDEITLLRVSNVKTGREEERARVALLDKGVEVIDKMAGTVMAKVMEAHAESAAPAAALTPLQKVNG